MRVVYFSRRPLHNVYYSMEKSFATSQRHLPPDIQPVAAVSRYESRGLWKRLFNVVEAAFRQGEVNHITGDVHFLALLLRKRKTVLTIHDCVFETRSSRVKKWLLLWLWYIIPVRRVAVVTVVSEFTKSRLIGHTKCTADKIQVVPTCVSDTFRRIDRPFDAACPTILQVGTLENKNLDRLVAALVGIPCRLQIVGKLSSAQREMLDASGLDYANTFGLNEEELVQQYASCDLVAFVSTYEGFGMPIVEANTVGRPVVTGNVASMPEISGDAACLVDPFDVNSIRDGLLKVLRDASYREALVQNGFRNRLRFLPEAVARQYAEIYRMLTDDRARPGASLPPDPVAGQG